MKEGEEMPKNNIHPKYFVESTVKCACGNTFITGSTKNNLHVEVCSMCHPFFIGGKQKYLDTGGRIDKFNKKFGIKA